MKIRKAIPSDFLPIAALDREAWKQNEAPDFIPDGEHVWRIWCEYSLVYVAEKEGKIAGAILAFLCENNTYCLHKVFVDRTIRNQGLGTKLFQHLLEKTDEKGKATFLTVNPNNSSALKLYEKWGYEKSKLVKGYYREDEDRYIMFREPQT